jgi:hypothetical protein
MGAFIDSLSVRTNDSAAVRTAIVRWLGAKGFELRAEAPLFQINSWEDLHDDSDERGVLLFSNAAWTVVLYSHMTREGDRLLFELGQRDAPVLKTWVHDGDVWGYELHRRGDLLASFSSNLHYFGVDESMPLPRNGDPALLCEVCGLAGMEAQLEAAQRARRQWFSEHLSERFCGVIGATPAKFDYRDLAGGTMVEPGLHTLGDFAVEHLYFVRRGAERAESPDLHALPLRLPPAAETSPPGEIPPLPLELRALGYFFRGFWFVMRPVIYVLAFILRAWLKWRHWRHKGEPQVPSDPFHQALLAAHKPSYRVDGRQLINDRHGCRITLPEQCAPGEHAIPYLVFHFTVQGQPVYCEAVRPSAIEARLQPWAGAVVLEDEKFFVGELRARCIVRQTVGHAATHTIHLFVVQGPRAFYAFTFPMPQPTAEIVARLRQVVESFVLESP